MRTVPALVAMSSARTGTGQSRCRTLSYTARNRARAASLENPGMRGDLAIPSFSRRRTAPARIEVAHRPVLRPTLVARTRLAVAADGADCPQSRLEGRSRTSVRHRRTGIPSGTPKERIAARAGRPEAGRFMGLDRDAELGERA